MKPEVRVMAFKIGRGENMEEKTTFVWLITIRTDTYLSFLIRIINNMGFPKVFFF